MPDWVIATVGEAFSFLTGIAPPNLAVAAGRHAPRGSMDREGRVRLWGALSDVVDGLAATRPVVVFFDDLHWADRSSIGALEFVAQRLGKSKTLPLGAYTDTDLPAEHPFSDTLGTLARLRYFTRVHIEGLDAGETARLVRHMARGAAGQRIADEIYGVTEGNPFYAREISREIADSWAERKHGSSPLSREAFPLPGSVKEVIGRRHSGGAVSGLPPGFPHPAPCVRHLTRSSAPCDEIAGRLVEGYPVGGDRARDPRDRTEPRFASA